MEEAQERPAPRPKSKTNQKLKKARTKPIALTPTGPVKEAIAIFQANPVPLIAGCAIMVGGAMVINVVGFVLGFFFFPLVNLAQVASILWSAYIGANLVQMALDAHDRKPIAVSQLLGKHPHLVNFLATGFIVSVATGIGSFLLVIPGIVAMALLTPATALAVEKGLDPVSALQRSVAITKPRLMELSLVWLVFSVLNFVGTIPLGLGLLATIPITLIGTACVYRSLEG